MKSSKTDKHKFGESQVLVLSTQPPTHTLGTLAVFLWKSREMLLPRSESVLEILYLECGIWDFILLVGIFFYFNLIGGIWNYPVLNI